MTKQVARYSISNGLAGCYITCHPITEEDMKMSRPLYNEFNERTDKFRVVLFAYCGVRQTIAECDDYADARATVAAEIKWARKCGQPTSTLVCGQEWELGEPDDCIMVPDHAGTLAIRYPAHCDDDED